MRLLQNRVQVKPLGESKIVPNRQEIEKLIEKEKNQTRVQALEYAKELQEKLATLQKVQEQFSKSTEAQQGYVEEITKKIKDALAEADGFSGLVAKKFRVSQEEVDDKILKLENVSLEAGKAIEKLAQDRESMESSFVTIAERIRDFTHFSYAAKEGKEEFEKKKEELIKSLDEIRAEYANVQKTQGEVRVLFGKETARLQELAESLQADKIQVASAKGEFEKLQERFSAWQATLEKHEAEIFPKAEEKASVLKELSDSLREEVDRLGIKYGSLEDVRQKLTQASDVFQQEKAEAERIKKESKELIAEAQIVWGNALDYIKKTEKGLNQAKNDLERDQIELKSSIEDLKEAQNTFQKLKIEANNQKIDFQNDKEQAQKALLEIQNSCNRTFDSLSRKIVDLEDQGILLEKASKEFVEVKNIANGYIVLAEQKKRELLEAQEKEKAYFDKRKQEIEEAGQTILQDKLQIQAAKEQFKKAEENFKEWERGLKDYQSALHSTFQELKQYGGSA